MKTDAVAGQVLELILELSNAPAGGEGEAARGVLYHSARIREFVRRGEPVMLVLPAFPAKSSNPEKTLGVLPDYGEVLALKRLELLCRDVESVYAPGARLIVCSDGRVFSDLVQVSDDAVNRYGRGIENILRDYGLKRLSMYNLDDAFPYCVDHDERRRRLVSEEAAPLERVRARTLTDPDAMRLFNGMHRFLFEDLLVLRPELRRTKVRGLAKELAYSVIQRSKAWSGLVERTFPEAVRLSIHPQPLNSRKLGVRLLPSDSAWRTPWHSVVLFDGENHRLVRRRDAEESRAVLLYADGIYPYFMIPQDARSHAHDGSA